MQSFGTTTVPRSGGVLALGCEERLFKLEHTAKVTEERLSLLENMVRLNNGNCYKLVEVTLEEYTQCLRASEELCVPLPFRRECLPAYRGNVKSMPTLQVFALET